MISYAVARSIRDVGRTECGHTPRATARIEDWKRTTSSAVIHRDPPWRYFRYQVFVSSAILKVGVRRSMSLIGLLALIVDTLGRVVHCGGTSLCKVQSKVKGVKGSSRS